MSKFFGFINKQENYYTYINTDNIIVINKKVGTLNGNVISQAQVLVEVGKDVKEYILDEDQYNSLIEELIPCPRHSVGGPG